MISEKIKIAICVMQDNLLKEFDYDLEGDGDEIIANYLITSAFMENLKLYKELHEANEREWEQLR